MRDSSQWIMILTISLATLIHSSRIMNPSPSMMALIEASESKSGLAMIEVDVAKYTFDGGDEANALCE